MSNWKYLEAYVTEAFSIMGRGTVLIINTNQLGVRPHKYDEIEINNKWCKIFGVEMHNSDPAAGLVIGSQMKSSEVKTPEMYRFRTFDHHDNTEMVEEDLL